MSGAAADFDLGSTGGVVATKLPGGATLPFPADAVGECRRPYVAGVDVRAACHSASAA